jgi:hypothetical protein
MFLVTRMQGLFYISVFDTGGWFDYLAKCNVSHKSMCMSLKRFHDTTASMPPLSLQLFLHVSIPRKLVAKQALGNTYCPISRITVSPGAFRGRYINLQFSEYCGSSILSSLCFFVQLVS